MLQIVLKRKFFIKRLPSHQLPYIKLLFKRIVLPLGVSSALMTIQLVVDANIKLRGYNFPKWDNVVNLTFPIVRQKFSLVTLPHSTLRIQPQRKITRVLLLSAKHILMHMYVLSIYLRTDKFHKTQLKLRHDAGYK